ncbi:MAG: hypothetical protein EPO09_12150 [Aquabacterium sp.]|uniref:hypothetical protein n=1 Tax=Aquabacterium sp. TaxID=1872578 RepID=UPI0011FCFC69|nr:hypothetical protein [Aquabacterium sp.]TAK93622.1 MAG: hypothetical protein EPO09_12150 [Aquabacterium sp.]
MRTDWQSIVTMAICLMAAGYLARRWWPGLKGLLAPAPAASPSGLTACGTATAPSASCSSGCGNCGSTAAAPGKDHRIHVVKRDQG